MKHVYLAAALLVPALIAPRALAVTFGAEYAQDDACGNAVINNTKPDAEGFVSWMQAFGHSRKYFYGNSNFWPTDEVDSSVSGGLDSYYGDNANVTFYATHGSSNSSRFLMTTGATKTIDGVSTCRSYTDNPNNNKQWWKLGDKSARILCLSTCQGLELSDLAHWDGVANGLHMITGFDGNESDTPSVGGNFALWANLGLSVKQAWFNARPSGNKAVVMAYGINSSDARNRRDNEKLSWSMAKLGPHTYRAWSWIQ